MDLPMTAPPPAHKLAEEAVYRYFLAYPGGTVEQAFHDWFQNGARANEAAESFCQEIGASFLERLSEEDPLWPGRVIGAWFPPGETLATSLSEGGWRYEADGEFDPSEDEDLPSDNRLHLWVPDDSVVGRFDLVQESLDRVSPPPMSAFYRALGTGPCVGPDGHLHAPEITWVRDKTRGVSRLIVAVPECWARYAPPAEALLEEQPTPEDD